MTAALKNHFSMVPLNTRMLSYSNSFPKWLSQQALAMTLTSALLGSEPVCHHESLSLVPPELSVPSQLLHSGDCLISAMI